MINFTEAIERAKQCVNFEGLDLKEFLDLNVIKIIKDEYNNIQYGCDNDETLTYIIERNDKNKIVNLTKMNLVNGDCIEYINKYNSFNQIISMLIKYNDHKVQRHIYKYDDLCRLVELKIYDYETKKTYIDIYKYDIYNNRKLKFRGVEYESNGIEAY